MPRGVSPWVSTGPGSIFFEKLFAGLEGRADSMPAGGGDGVVTVDELASYLKYEVQVSTDQNQNPQFGDISKNGSLGGFFFLNRLKPLEAGMMTAWKPGAGLAFGANESKPVVSTNVPTPSLPRQLTQTITGQDGASMVLVSEGTFWMGSTDEQVETVVKECVGYDFEEEKCRGWYKGEVPRHKVVLPTFYMDTAEVTNRLFQEFVKSTGHQTTAEREGDARAFVKGKGWETVKGASWRKPEGKEAVFVSNRTDHPVVSVSWDDATAYCEHYDKRLPSEAEWEYAARAGTPTRNWWGNDPPSSRRVANIADVSTKALFKNYLASYDDGFEQTAPVRVMGTNPWGLYDMIGNVAEWTVDWYGEDYYSQSTTSSPRGPSTGTYRVIRGGSWGDEPSDARSAVRDRNPPTNRNNRRRSTPNCASYARRIGGCGWSATS